MTCGSGLGLCLLVVCLGTFMICGIGLSGYVFDMWHWSVWICF
jgi:hypothetical protein